jgi:hypothetical protein
MIRLRTWTRHLKQFEGIGGDPFVRSGFIMTIPWCGQALKSTGTEGENS